MPIVSIEQSRVTGTRSNGEAGAANAGDPAGLFALLMATLGMPLQIAGAANGQGQNLALPATPQNAMADASVDGADLNVTNNGSPKSGLSAGPITALNTAPVLTGQLPGGAPIDIDLPEQPNFVDLAQAAGSAVPSPVASTPRSTIPAMEMTSAQSDMNGPTARASTPPMPVFAPPAPAFTATETGDTAAPAPVRAHPAASAPSDVVEADLSRGQRAQLEAASREAASLAAADSAQRSKAGESPAAPAATSRALSDMQTEIADTAPLSPAPNRSQATLTERPTDSGSERPMGGKNAHASTVELPSVAVTAIQSTPAAQLLPERSEASGMVSEAHGPTMAIGTGAPGMFASTNDAPRIDEASRQVEPIGARPMDLSATARPMPGTEATTLRPEVAAPAVAVERTALQHVGAHITRAIAEGTDRLSLHLVPAELGRIDIALDVREDGQVKATVRADNPATLDLLQRDARNLERALESAGLRAESGSLSFSLRNDGRQNHAFSPSQNGETSTDVPAEDGLATPLISQTRSAARGLVDLTI